ncbi:hypothetical protein ABIB80_007905 [Bradyrhizobium sp. i1.15.2]
MDAAVESRAAANWAAILRRLSDGLPEMPLTSDPSGEFAAANNEALFFAMFAGDDRRDEDQRPASRHAPHSAPPVRRWPCRGEFAPAPPGRERSGQRERALPAAVVNRFPVIGSGRRRYRLRVGTSMVTTTATRTKTRTMASASKDPIALISVRPAIFPNVNSSEGRSRAANRIGGDYCALPSPRTRHVSGPSGCIDKRGDRATAPLRHICVFRFLCFLCCICF